MNGQIFSKIFCYQVQFEIGDIKRQNYPDNTFDMIYSRDTLLHIDGKEKLFAKFKVNQDKFIFYYY